MIPKSGDDSHSGVGLQMRRSSRAPLATEPPQPPDPLNRPVAACPDYQERDRCAWTLGCSAQFASAEARDRRWAANHKAADAGILVIIQKVFDIPFVPPLDVLTGTVTSPQTLKERELVCV